MRVQAMRWLRVVATVVIGEDIVCRLQEIRCILHMLMSIAVMDSGLNLQLFESLGRRVGC